MANSFLYNALTPDGMQLIARATAAQKLIFTGAKSCTLAATSVADLASKPLSWYDGKSGVIHAVSATGNVARIVSQFKNAGQGQIAKSFCITAKIEGDADSVVLAALSDPDAQIYLPGEDDLASGADVPFAVAVTSNDDVEVTPGASASLADLDRFVSMHSAGDPSVGDVQTILGDKTFEDNVTFEGRVIFGSNAMVTGDVRIESEHITARADAELIMVSKEYARLVSSTDLSDPFNNPPYAMVATRYNSDGNNASVLFRVKRATTDEYGVNYSIYIGGRPSLFPVQANTDLGVSDNKWDNVYANFFKGDLDGLIPTTGYSQLPAIGSIFLAHIEARASIGNKGVGQTVTNDDYSIRKAMLSIDSNARVTVGFESAIVDITTGTYKLLSAIDGLSANEATVALVMRIS